jgi:hypothetical protein
MTGRARPQGASPATRATGRTAASGTAPVPAQPAQH